MFEWVAKVVEEAGYAGIFLLMLAENVFPPIPSELILPLAGFAAAQGRLNIAVVIAASAAGALTGALVWYLVGRRLGIARVRNLAARHGRWLTVSPGEVDAAQTWFARHCGKAVVLGRLIPAVRTLISLPPGVIGMALPRFLVYSALGTTVWSSVLVVTGYALENQYQRVAEWLNPVSTAIIAAVFGWYLYRLVTFTAAGDRRGPR